jgi:hypothetical protein
MSERRRIIVLDYRQSRYSITPAVDLTIQQIAHIREAQLSAGSQSSSTAICEILRSDGKLAKRMRVRHGDDGADDSFETLLTSNGTGIVTLARFEPGAVLVRPSLPPHPLTMTSRKYSGHFPAAKELEESWSGLSTPDKATCTSLSAI